MDAETMNEIGRLKGVDFYILSLEVTICIIYSLAQ